MSMSAPEGPAAHREKSGDAVFLFKVLWYASNVTVAIACGLSVYWLFGFEVLVYFIVGIAIVAGLAVAGIAARRLAAPLLKKPGK